MARSHAAQKSNERSVVARRIEEVREAQKMSRDDLAKKMGTTRMRIWRLENGTTEVSADDVPSFAEALGCSVAALYREPKSA